MIRHYLLPALTAAALLLAGCNDEQPTAQLSAAAPAGESIEQAPVTESHAEGEYTPAQEPQQTADDPAAIEVMDEAAELDEAVDMEETTEETGEQW